MVVIDPGHGGDDIGCQGYGLKEKDLTFSLAHQIKLMACAVGQDIALTRTSDERLALSERGHRAKMLGATQVLALHFDANPEPTVGRMMAYALPGDDASMALASCIRCTAPDWLRPSVLIRLDAVSWKRRAFNVVNAYRGTPTLLLECAFLTKPEHGQRLQQPTACTALGASIWAGVLAWLGSVSP